MPGAERVPWAREAAEGERAPASVGLTGPGEGGEKRAQEPVLACQPVRVYASCVTPIRRSRSDGSARSGTVRAHSPREGGMMATSMPSASMPCPWALAPQPRCMCAPLNPTHLCSSTIDVSSGGCCRGTPTSTVLRTCQAGASEEGVPADTQRSCKSSTLLRRIPLAHHEATRGWWTTLVWRDCRGLV